MTLKEALHIVLKVEHLGDMVYYVRSDASEAGDGYKGDSWDHPRVKAFGEAVARLEKELKS